MSSIFNIVPLSPDCFWVNFSPPTIQFCENNLCGLITQPANTWSNFAYIFVGTYLLFKDKANGKITGWIAILIGISSFLYHASFTFLMQYFDLSSMFLFSSFFLTANLCRSDFLKTKNRVKTMFLIVAVSMGLLYFFRKTGIPIFSLQIIAAGILELYIFKNKNLSSNYKNILTALILFIVAFVIWLLDLFKIFCDKDNHIFQGHAIWHILTALSILFIHKFYSESFGAIGTDQRK